MSEPALNRTLHLTIGLLAPLLACNAPDNGGPDSTRKWHSVVTDAPGAMLAMWSSSTGTVWAVGAARDRDGPMVLKRQEGDWVRVLTGLSTNLWWVHGFDDGAQVVMAGDDGAVVDYTAADQRFAYSSIENASNLYGLWGATIDDVWFVGRGLDGDGLISRRRFGRYDNLATPATVPSGEAFFKVWGTAANHVLFVGEMGSLLRWDGIAFTHDTALAGNRLVTVHGRSADDMVVVGGRQTGLIFEGDSQGTWIDRSPPVGALLNGVFVAPDGYAAAAGFLGAVFERLDGAWAGLPYPDTFADWHAAHVDARGDVWVAGGNLLATNSLNAGALLRFGPPRSDDGQGAWTRQDATVVNAPPRDAATDSSNDSGIDVDEDPGPDANVERSQQGDFLLMVGQSGVSTFRLLPEGADVEIVQGPQGGIHGEVTFQVTIPTAMTDKVVGAMQATIAVDDAIVGFIDVPSYPVTSVTQGATTYTSAIIPIFLEDSDAGTYANQEGIITVEFSYLGKTGSQAVSVRLVDEW